MTARRRRISPRLMESLQILKFSINKGQHLDFTKGLSWEDELKDFEKAARMAPFGEVEAYGRTVDMVAEDSDDMDDNLNDLLKESEVESNKELGEDE
jgi:hypothetical protein